MSVSMLNYYCRRCLRSPYKINKICYRFYYADADMLAHNYDRRTALHLAACEGHSDCVKFLVEKCRINPLVKDR